MTWDTLKSTGEKLDISNTVMVIPETIHTPPSLYLTNGHPPPFPLACPTTIDLFSKQEAQFTHIMNPNK